VVSDGCAIDQATATVIVHAAPSAGNDGSFTVCLNEPFDLLLGINGNIDLNGTWYNPTNQAMASNIDTAGSLAGSFNYDYIVESAYCPSDTSNVLVIVSGSCDFTASINELTSSFEVYPNPTKDEITIEWAGGSLANITIFDIQGKRVKEISSVDNLMKLSLNDCENGVYLVQVEANSAKMVKRIIKN
jgi:hypothetical protein